MKIQNNNISFFKKITGGTIAELAGMNKFKPRGDAVLAMLGYVKEPFDKFYTDRGALAERLALRSLLKRGLPCVVYDPERIDYDNFPNNPYFGGMIDIEIPAKKTLYEIKSKNVKDYDKIVQYGDSCQEEQAMHYGYLRGYNEVHIMWIFFDDETETLIRNGEPVTSYKNLKMFEKPLTVDYDKQKKIHLDSLLYYIHCLALQQVPLEDVSEKYQKLLKPKLKKQNDFQNSNPVEQIQINLFGEVV